jgi:hypothetical protein
MWWDEGRFWNDSSSSVTEIATQHERLNTFLNANKLFKLINSNNVGLFYDKITHPKAQGMSIADFMTLKKTAIMSNVARVPDFALEDPQREEELTSEYVSQSGLLTEEEAKVLQVLKNQVSAKMIQLYFDSYMAPLQSDIKWRLGDVTGLYMPNEAQYQFVIDAAGYMDTRSNFKPSLMLRFWDGAAKGINSGDIHYTNLSFPPFRLSSKKYVNGIWVDGGGDSADNFVAQQNAKDDKKIYDEEITPTTSKLSAKQTELNREEIKGDAADVEVVKALKAEIKELEASISASKAKLSFSYSDEYVRHSDFDIDNFRLKKLGFTYREPAFKAINDNITFLQWMLERAVGIVPTYLTEWDLSLYMQEHMMSSDPTGLTSHMLLDYRIRYDNPMGYTDSKALTFGVLNAAVSKYAGNNLKFWRPSDHPLSPYWMPYFRGDNPLNYHAKRTPAHGYQMQLFDDAGNVSGWSRLDDFVKSKWQFNGDPRDWYIEYVPLFDKESGEVSVTPYMSVYDEVLEFFSANTDKEKISMKDFDYGRAVNTGGIKSIVKYQDFSRMILSGWNSMDIQYYQALYTTSEDGLSESDIRMDGLVKKVQGAPTVPSIGDDTNAMGKAMGLGEIGADQFMSMVSAGGYVGGDVPAGTQAAGGVGSYKNKKAKFLKWMVGKASKDGEVDPGEATNSLGSALSSSDEAAASYFSSSPTVKVDANGNAIPGSASDKKNAERDTSTMAKSVGVNRFSPIMYGGPFGSSYSPLSIQGYFERDNQFLRNTPRVSPNNALDFTAKINMDAQHSAETPESRPLERSASEKVYPDIRKDARYYADVNQYYKHWTGQQDQSPSSAIGLMKNGSRLWTTAYARVYTRIDAWHYARVIYRNSRRNCYYVTWPSYVGEPSYTSSYWGWGYWLNWWYRSRWWTGYFLRDTNGNIIYDKDGNPRRADYGDRWIRYYGNTHVWTETKVWANNYWGAYGLFRWWSNWWSYYNDYGYIWWGHSYAGWKWYVTKTIYARMGWYIDWVVKPYKRYNLHDEPYVNWKIVNHSFYVFDHGDTTRHVWWWPRWYYAGWWVWIVRWLFLWSGNSTPYWNLINSVRSVLGFRKIWGTVRLRTLNRLLLEGDSTETPVYQRPIASKLIQTMTSKDPSPPINLVFLEGTRNDATPPESIFVAGVSVNYYPKLIYSYHWTYRWRCAHRCWYACWHLWVVWVPYLHVDMSTEYSMGFFADKLNQSPFNNINRGSKELPLQFDSLPPEWDSTYLPTTDIMAKFKPWYYDEIGSSATNPSGGNMGLHGRGILAQIPALEPDVEDSTFESFSEALKNPQPETRQIQNYQWLAHRITGRYHQVRFTDAGEPYEVLDGHAAYSTYLMPTGIQRMLANLYTRATFYRSQVSQGPGSYGSTHQNSRVGWRPGPVLISIDNPFRTLLNILLQQHSFLKILKHVLLDSISFDSLYEVINNCVDKCVLKANGYYVPSVLKGDPPDQTTPVSDKKHILYNYWLDEFFKIVGFAESRDTKRATIENDWNNRLNVYQSSISRLQPLCDKPATQWTYEEVREAWNVVAIVEADSRTISNAEKYIMGYLNVLYQYRAYFLCKRYNKEDGTMWIMRALESVLNFIAPVPNEGGQEVKPIAQLDKKERAYKVAFSEIQNTTLMKRDSFINEKTLPVDRVKTVYVRVKWTTKEAYEEWLKYEADPNGKDPVDEVVRVRTPYDLDKRSGRRWRYAKKPVDDFYTLVSKEMTDHTKNVKFNNSYVEQIARGEIEPKNTYVYNSSVETEYDIAKWHITWGDSPDEKTIRGVKCSNEDNWTISNGSLVGTPIFWNVFAGVDVSKVLDYYEDGISPEELICLAEEGADFWTVHVPEDMWPRSAGLKTKVYLKHYDPIPPTKYSITSDAQIALLGAQAYSLWPITENQDNPIPAVALAPGIAGTVANLVSDDINLRQGQMGKLTQASQLTM